LTELVYSLRESSKNGGNHDLYLAMVRMSSLVMVITGAHLYIELAAYERLLWLVESEFVREVYTTLMWLRKTATGETEFADLWVEKMVGHIRFRFGKKSRRDMDNSLLQFMLRLNDAVKMRGSGKNTSAAADASAVRVGTVKVGRVLGTSWKNFEKHCVHGAGHKIDGCFKVDKGLVDMPAGAYGCLNGDGMDQGLTECLLTADKRLELFYTIKVYDGGAKPSNWNQMVPTSTGSLAQAAHDQQWRDTCISSNTMGSRTTKCTASANEALFGKQLLTEYLRHVRDHHSHRMAVGNNVPVPDSETLKTLVEKIPHTKSAEPFSMPASELADLLARIRVESKICEVPAPKRRKKESTDVSHYAAGAPSEEALGHYVFENKLATQLATTPDATHNGHPQQKFKAAGFTAATDSTEAGGAGAGAAKTVGRHARHKNMAALFGKQRAGRGSSRGGEGGRGGGAPK
jgi:hypothetical protein